MHAILIDNKVCMRDRRVVRQKKKEDGKEKSCLSILLTESIRCSFLSFFSSYIDDGKQAQTKIKLLLTVDI